MPYTMKKEASGKFSVSGPSGKHAKGTTKAKAEAQMRLLHGVEHGMKPRKHIKMGAEGAESKSTSKRKSI